MSTSQNDNEWRTVELIEQDDAGEAVRSKLPSGTEAILVPGYLLIRGQPATVKRLERHPLVKQVLKGRVSHSEAKAIEMALVHAVPPPPVLDLGQRVTVLEGPASGLPGEVVELPGDGTVRVCVHLQSRDCTVSVPVTGVAGEVV